MTTTCRADRVLPSASRGSSPVSNFISINRGPGLPEMHTCRCIRPMAVGHRIISLVRYPCRRRQSARRTPSSISTLPPLAIGVTVGELMFATLHADFSGGMYATQNTYADGSEWGCGPSYGIVCWTAADNGIPDLVFRSHVVPIPASGSVTLFALGFAGLGLPRRRRLKSSTRI